MFLLNKKTFQALAAPYRTEGAAIGLCKMAVLQRHHQP